MFTTPICCLPPLWKSSKCPPRPWCELQATALLEGPEDAGCPEDALVEAVDAAEVVEAFHPAAEVQVEGLPLRRPGRTP
eukprot:14157338-Alexandrium_andersonii.AAC.1